jgi:hypothetical protein
MTLTFVNFLRSPNPELPCLKIGHMTKTYLRRARWKRALVNPTSTIFFSSRVYRQRRSPYETTDCPASSTAEVYYGIQPRGFGNHLKSAATWVSTSAQRQATSTHPRRNSSRALNKQDNSSDGRHATRVGYPLRTYHHAHDKPGTSSG